MRATIATDYEGQLYELVSVHETSGGVYLALCLQDGGDLHFSYHRDGVRHGKYKGTRIPMYLERAAPLSEVTTPQQLGGSASYLGEQMAGLRLFRTKRDRSAVILFTHEVFPLALALSAYILSCENQEPFMHQMYRDFGTGAFMLVGVNLFALQHFPGKLVGIVFYQGRAAETVSQSWPT